jgi:hypothetical protein
MEGFALVLAAAVLGSFGLTVVMDHLAERFAPQPVAVRRRPLDPDR